LIGNDGNDEPHQPSTNNTHKATASATLLAEKKQRQQNASLFENLGDFVPISSLKPATENHYLDQIASSTTEPPTYWKSNNNSSGKAKAVKSSSTLTMISKAKSAKMKKGEDYKDRFSNKHQKRGGDPLGHLKSKKA
jgi:hypothetical protein